MSDEGDLHRIVRTALEDYLKQLDGECPSLGIYDMIIDTVEQPMLEVVMKYAQGNQSLCASLLGINRNTLRKKLLKCGLLKGE